jgi:hypothetical protein
MDRKRGFACNALTNTSCSGGLQVSTKLVSFMVSVTVVLAWSFRENEGGEYHVSRMKIGK